MELEVGQICAACIPELDNWIVAKVEKKSPGGKYIVKDPYDPEPETCFG